MPFDVDVVNTAMRGDIAYASDDYGRRVGVSDASYAVVGSLAKISEVRDVIHDGGYRCSVHDTRDMNRDRRSVANTENNQKYDGNPNWACDYKAIKKKTKKNITDSSVIDDIIECQNFKLVKPKKKKTKLKKKKLKTTSVVPSCASFNQKRSCHSRCKEYYENDSRGSVSKLGDLLKYQPMYQNLSSNKLQKHPTESHKKLIRKTSHDTLPVTSSINNLSSMKKNFKPKPKTTSKITSTPNPSNITKSMAYLNPLNHRPSILHSTPSANRTHTDTISSPHATPHTPATRHDTSSRATIGSHMHGGRVIVADGLAMSATGWPGGDAG